MSGKKAIDSYSAPALSKGLEILELLARSREPMPPIELARASGRTPGEQFRMLAVLQQHDYIRRDRSGSYLPTLKLFCIAQQSRPLEQIVRAARGPMRDFSETTGQECHLGALEDGRLVVLAQQSGTHAVTLYVRPGSMHHPAHTLSGRMLLSTLTGTEIEWHLRRANDFFAMEMNIDGVFQKGLQRLRNQTDGRARDESLKGVADYAVRIGNPSFGWQVVLASTWFHTTLGRDGRRTLEARLRETADHIQAGLGLADFQPENPFP